MKSQPILEYVISKLAECRLKDVAEESGVPFSSVNKIAHRHTTNPGVNNVQALYDYFRAKEKKAA